MYLARNDADQKHSLNVFNIFERQMREVHVILKQAKAVANVNNLDFGGFRLKDVKLTGLIKYLVENPNSTLEKAEKGLGNVLYKDSTPSQRENSATVIKRNPSSDVDTNATPPLTSEGSRVTVESKPAAPSLKVTTRNQSFASDMGVGRPSPGIRGTNPFFYPVYEQPQVPINPVNVAEFQNPFMAPSSSGDPARSEIDQDEDRDQYNPFQASPQYPTRSTLDRRQSNNSFYPNDYIPPTNFVPVANPYFISNPHIYDRRTSQLIFPQENPYLNYDHRQSYGNPFQPPPEQINYYYTTGNPFVQPTGFMRTQMAFHYAPMPIQNIQPLVIPSSQQPSAYSSTY